jgi:hypothetical protein
MESVWANAQYCWHSLSDYFFEFCLRAFSPRRPCAQSHCLRWGHLGASGRFVREVGSAGFRATFATKLTGSTHSKSCFSKLIASSLLGQWDRLHFCRIFGLVAALLARSETPAGIFPRSRLATKQNLSPLSVAYPTAKQYHPVSVPCAVRELCIY